MPLGAGATFLLALAAFWAIWQNYRINIKDKKYKRIIQRTETIQKWIFEIYHIASSSSPPGDDQEIRIRKWQIQKVSFFANKVKNEAKKLDREYELEEKLESIIDVLSKEIEEHKENPEALARGVRSGEAIIDIIKNNSDKAIKLLSDIKDTF